MSLSLGELASKERIIKLLIHRDENIYTAIRSTRGGESFCNRTIRLTMVFTAIESTQKGKSFSYIMIFALRKPCFYLNSLLVIID